VHKHYTHYSGGVRGGTKAAAPPLSSGREEVDGLLKPETSHASAQGVRGSKKPLSRWPEDMLQRNLHCSTYNINIHRGCLEPAVLRKLLSKTRPGTPLPLPRPPKKKRSTTSPKTSPSSLSSPVRCRDRSHRQSPSANPVQRTSAKGSTPRTSKRPRVDAIKNALFESSCHAREAATGFVPTTFPEGTQPRRVPAQWARTSTYWPQSGA